MCSAALICLDVFHLFSPLRLEYQLVAGGEELFQENGLLAPKSDPSRSTPSDVHVKEESKEMQSPFAPRTPSDCSEFASEGESASLDALHVLGGPTERTPGAFLAPLPIAQSSQTRGVIKDEGFELNLPFPPRITPPSSFVAPSVSPTRVVRNYITAVSLCADGMRPLVVDVGRYASPSSSLLNYPPRASIHIKLSLSSLHDVSSPPTLHGFSGTVSFAAPWTSMAQCVTRVFAGGVCESEEFAYFEAAAPLLPLSMTPVTVSLPESGLSSCRWGNIGACMLLCSTQFVHASLTTRAWTGVETRIIQQVIVDHEDLAWITYDLTRTASGPPTAEVLSVHRDSRLHVAPTISTPLPESTSLLNLNTWHSGTSYAHTYTPYVPRSQEPHTVFSPYSSLSGSSSGNPQYTHYSPSVLFS